MATVTSSFHIGQGVYCCEQLLSITDHSPAGLSLPATSMKQGCQLCACAKQTAQGLGTRGFAAQSRPPANLQRPRTIMDRVHAMQKAVKRHAAAPTRAGRAAKQNLIRTGEKAYELLPARVSNLPPAKGPCCCQLPLDQHVMADEHGVDGFRGRSWWTPLGSLAAPSECSSCMLKPSGLPTVAKSWRPVV